MADLALGGIFAHRLRDQPLRPITQLVRVLPRCWHNSTPSWNQTVHQTRGDSGLLLADEPTGNLDPTTAHEILDLSAALQAERGTTVIIATHDPTIAQRAHHVVHVTDGVAHMDRDLTDW